MRLLFMLLGNVCIPAMVAYLVGRNNGSVSISWLP